MNRTFYIYMLYVHKYCCAEAYTEEQKQDQFQRKLLFTCPEEWLPNTKEQFLKACAFYKQEVPADIEYVGYVPF